MKSCIIAILLLVHPAFALDIVGTWQGPCRQLTESASERNLHQIDETSAAVSLIKFSDIHCGAESSRETDKMQYQVDDKAPLLNASYPNGMAYVLVFIVGTPPHGVPVGMCVAKSQSATVQQEQLYFGFYKRHKCQFSANETYTKMS